MIRSIGVCMSAFSIDGDAHIHVRRWLRRFKEREKREVRSIVSPEDLDSVAVSE